MAVLSGYEAVARDIRAMYPNQGRAPLFTMDATKKILDDSKSTEDTTVAEDTKKKPADVPPMFPQDTEGGRGQPDIDDPNRSLTTAQDVRDLQDRVSFSTNPTKQKVATTALKVGAAFLGPAAIGLVGLYEGFTTGLGAIAATMESFEDGVLGDAFGSRTNEETRDALEYGGYSRSESASAQVGGASAYGTGGTPTERANQEMARASGDSGAGDTGVSEGATAGSGAPGTGGTAQESAGTEMGRASGLGSGGSLGDAAAGDNDSSGSDTGSNDAAGADGTNDGIGGERI